MTSTEVSVPKSQIRFEEQGGEWISEVADWLFQQSSALAWKLQSSRGSQRRTSHPAGLGKVQWEEQLIKSYLFFLILNLFGFWK